MLGSGVRSRSSGDRRQEIILFILPTSPHPTPHFPTPHTLHPTPHTPHPTPTKNFFSRP
ncbi:unknown protein [Microcystis aeruginosa NIES-843]|uniref:Uncharacterized protein n=1 Tax=Microcystis aeruginosa (strain NIES-843 / IAM M-2473) TaxID=449447 RepID=B0JGF8_MICAN|nr:unknown protein [Microcystis aeruginosa NIES-843]